ncbi:MULTISPECIES: EF-hand domain-containing protein [Alphaproteobacteria]|uniref:EF-hand domain-containing protein n=2 Tax=Alphaproteobacteria TaxID=28211 RepID=A0A512HGB6_9HYPH|nr:MULTISPECIES: EF-hand domain-containing protein [Alphaproteobacteria]GEO84493.1 hypothetical protein RNA01_14250 [Ciceribacter naphthalenivorans]GLR22456.1 hypothetical protein GCM10007920_22430 [Ciceribacter naphthalenivorans]GLT05312.1 hypothetical protein GCM10007926_22430 [Sphingomonas psychrolutea]
MTSVSSSSGASSLYSSSISSLDTNGDGVISADELAAAESGNQRTQNPTVSSDSAASGPISQVTGGFMALLLSGDNSGLSDEQQKSSSDMFASMDTDGDGKVTEAEFVASRPDDVSEENATAFFAKLDGEGTGTLTEEQFVSAMEANRPDGPPPSPVGEASASDSESETVSLLDVLAEMQQVIAAYAANGGETAAETADSKITL